ncbi:MAG: hypothetical protein NTW47_22300, partial [Proteobacteria bacterium]|nr:hypothetical protein [Pseudomonadota bacterium]
AIGTSGSVSCCFICVQGGQTAAALRGSSESLRVLTAMCGKIALIILRAIFTNDATHAQNQA